MPPGRFFVGALAAGWLVEVAGGHMSGGDFFVFGDFDGAFVHSEGATGVETAA